MATIPIKTDLSSGIRVEQPVLQDPALAISSSERRLEAATKINAFADSMIDQRQKYADNDFMNRSVNEANLLYSNEFLRLQTEELNNPEGAADRFQEFINRDMDGRLSEARTPAIRSQLEDNLTQQMISFGTKGQVWENNRQIKLLDTSINQQTTALTELSGRSGGKRLEVDKYFEQGIKTINDASGALPKENLVVKRDQFKGKLYGTAIESMIIASPQQAILDLEKGAWDDVLSPKQVRQSLSIAKSRRSQQTAVERSELQREKVDQIARAEKFGNPDMTIVSKIEVLEGTEEADVFTAQILLAKETFNVTTQMKNMTNSAINLKVREMERILEEDDKQPNFAQKDRQLTIAKLAQRNIQKRREEDPGGAAREALMKSNPTPNELIAYQETIGLSDTEKGIMTKPQALVAVGRISNAPRPEDALEVLDGLRAQFGDGTLGAEDNFGFVMQDLIRNGLDPQLSVLAVMRPVQDQPTRRLAVKVFDTPKSELRGFMESDVADSIEALVDENLLEYQKTYLNDPNTNLDNFTPMRELTKKIALTLQVRGVEPAQAAKQATDYINTQFNFPREGRQTLRVPLIDGQGRGISEEAVMDMTVVKRDMIRDNTDKLIVDQLQTAADQALRPQLVDSILRDSYWVTDAEEKGLSLHYLGQPVRIDAEGVEIPVRFEFIEAVNQAAASRSHIKEKVKKATKDAIKRQRRLEEMGLGLRSGGGAFIE